MKLNFFSSLAVSGVMLAALTPALSQANHGNIRFEGQITSVSCIVNVDANGLTQDSNAVVSLGKVSPLVFTDVGSNSDFKNFDIYLSGPGCTNGSKATVKFMKSPYIDLGTGNLRLVGEGSASGVQIQIWSNNDGEQSEKIDLSGNSTPVVTVDKNKAVLKFKASYVSVVTGDQVVAGWGNSNIDFEIDYI